MLGDGGWHSSTNNWHNDEFGNLANYIAAKDSRYLSVGASENITWLVYEATDGGVALLNGLILPPNWIWNDISKDLEASRSNRLPHFSVPFTVSGGINLCASFAGKHANGSYSQVVLVATKDASPISTC